MTDTDKPEVRQVYSIRLFPDQKEFIQQALSEPNIKRTYGSGGNMICAAVELLLKGEST